MASDPNAGVCLIRRVVIRNYKSIAACDVELGPLTFLVGPNGSGKSNFLDALRFVSDSLRYSLEHAIRDRGGIRSVLRNAMRGQSGLAGPTTGIRVEFQLSNGMRGHYALEIRGVHDRFVVDREEAAITGGPTGKEESFFQASRGEILESSFPAAPAAGKDRLFLVTVSGMAEFRPLYDALSTIGCYNFSPEVIRNLRQPDAAELLTRDGANVASVFAKLAESNPALQSRIEEYLAQVVPGIIGVDYVPLGPLQTLGFRQYAGPKSRRGLRFLATNMSDGTLRAFAILVALFQRGADTDGPLLIGIEEPETALHPGAVAVLIDAIRDALSMRQVLVTSHSPDLLDNASIGDSEILAVVAEDGQTRMGRLDEAGRSVLRDHLFTAGDLLRMNQLRPDPAGRSLNPDDLELFGAGAPA